MFDGIGISEIMLFAAPVLTWLAAKFASRLKLLVGDAIFVSVVVPLIGAAISWMLSKLGQAGNSWLVSFLLTLGATWLQEVISRAVAAAKRFFS